VLVFFFVGFLWVFLFVCLWIVLFLGVFWGFSKCESVNVSADVEAHNQY